jgi:hypothetical protein
MPDGTPRVSVVIPCYDAAGFIGEALDSVLAQSYPSYEVLVVDDGSPDTPALEAALAPYSSRIRYVRQENQGPGGARNTGVRNARGELVAFLDSDDAWSPEFLAEQLRLLDADPGLDLVYADARLVGDPAYAGRTFMEVCPCVGEVTFESLLREECAVVTSCVVAKRQSLIDAGLFDVRFFHSEDFDLWLRLLHRGGRIAYQRAPLATHRVHAGSLVADGTRLIEGKIAVSAKLREQLELTASQRAALDAFHSHYRGYLALERGKQQLLGRRYRDAALHFRDARRALAGRKMWALAWGSRVAPWLLRRLYLRRVSARAT